MAYIVSSSQSPAGKSLQKAYIVDQSFNQSLEFLSNTKVPTIPLCPLPQTAIGFVCNIYQHPCNQRPLGWLVFIEHFYQLDFAFGLGDYNSNGENDESDNVNNLPM